MLPLVKPEPGRRYEPFPLTEMQQAYWLGRNSSFELGGVGIHFYEELDCRGIDLYRLNDAWQKTILRHDALRTVILNDGRQRVLEKAEYNIATVEASTEAALEALRDQLSHRCYTIEQWPSFEIVAARIDKERVRLFLSIDLNFTDLHGLGLIIHDWTRLYQGLDPGGEAPAISFRDYVLATQGLESTQEFQASREYWSNAAARLPAAPDLPEGKARGAIRPPRFERRTGVVDQASWASLKTIAARAGITPSCAVLAVYGEILRLWSSESAFAVNLTARNYLARHCDLGRVAGVFTSSAPLAFHPLSASFRKRAQATQEALSHVLRHRFAGSLWITRQLARLHNKTAEQSVLPVVFTSTFNTTPHPLPLLETFGRRVYHLVQTPQVSLDLQIYEHARQMVYHWDAVTEAFPPGVPQDMAAAFGETLASLAEESAWSCPRVCAVPTSQSERNTPASAVQADSESLLIDQLVWRSLPESQDRPALMTSSRALTRAELHKLAAKIANQLRGLGAKPDDPIAVVLEKSWEQVAAAHGVLLAGAAYVPIAPDLPQERWLYLLNHSKVRIALTTKAWRKSLPWPAAIELVTLEDSVEADLEPLSGNGRSSGDLAYILYTSGSTGTPKGVMIEHRSVVNRLLDVNRRFAIGKDDRVLALTAMHHDLSVYDLFGVLAADGAIVLPDADRLFDPAHWIKLMRAHRVTIWNSVPAYLDMLVTYLEHDRKAAPEDLRLVLLSGDWIPVNLPDRMRAIFPRAQVIALGGPTETTVWDICYPVGHVDPAWGSIPYGKAMANSKYYVMNDQLEERPDWVCGELFISGAGLARGYWADPEKTSRSFVSHSETGERLYRSGDLGRRLPDGNIEFLGRRDSQLKIRGYRIEAEEVALAIRKHPVVSNVLVRAEGDRNRGMRLAAYVVLDKSRTGYDPARKKLSELEQLEFRSRQLGLLNHSRRASILLDPALPEEISRQQRRSCRSFESKQLLFGSLSRLLSLLRGIPSENVVTPRYLYPSAGSLYPVRCYVCIKEDAVAELPQGAYYYHPIENSLQLVGSAVPESSAHLDHNRGLAETASFLLVLVAHFDAIEPVYGGMARDYCLLEAGYMGQLLMMKAAGLGIGLCPIGDLDRHRLSDLLSLDPGDEILHAMAGGVPGQECAYKTVQAPDWGEEIRKVLLRSLPEYMVPERIVVMNEFKLTANGKIDLNALPSSSEISLYDQEITEPTAGEREIAAVLAEILQVERVPVHRGFFELGCNSVQMVELMLRLQSRLKREIFITDLFAHPNVKALAQFLNGAETVHADGPLRRAALRSTLRSARAR